MDVKAWGKRTPPYLFHRRQLTKKRKDWVTYWCCRNTWWSQRKWWGLTGDSSVPNSIPEVAYKNEIQMALRAKLLRCMVVCSSSERYKNFLETSQFASICHLAPTWTTVKRSRVWTRPNCSKLSTAFPVGVINLGAALPPSIAWCDDHRIVMICLAWKYQCTNWAC